MSQVAFLSNSTLCYKAKKFLEEKGHKVQVKDLYALFAMLCDEPTWNHAKAQNIQIHEVLSQTVFVKDWDGSEGEIYEVKIRLGAEKILEMTKFYSMRATSRYLANHCLEQYLKIRMEGIEDTEEGLHPLTQAILDSESEEEFKLANWNVVWNDETDIKVEYHGTSPTPNDLWDYAYLLQPEAFESMFYSLTEDMASTYVEAIAGMWTMNVRSGTVDLKKTTTFFMKKWKTKQPE